MNLPQVALPLDPNPLRRMRARRRKVLVVDDEPLLLKSAARVLKLQDIDAVVAGNGDEALEKLEAGLDPDVVLTDLRMPGMNGSELVSVIRQRWPQVVRLCMSGNADRRDVMATINQGQIFRFIEKPWVKEDFDEAIRSAIHQADLLRENMLLQELMAQEHQLLATQKQGLEQSLQVTQLRLVQTEEKLDQALLETVRALAYTIEAKDPYTAGHSELVSLFAIALAKKVGLGHDEQETLRLGGVLHDVGKIAIPDTVLLKPGKLTDDEYAQVKCHPVVGARILKDIQFPYDILPVVRLHHERWDGRGYPDRLEKDQTPLLARITHVVDVFEAITARRVYRNPMPREKVISIFDQGRGTDFDPDLVDPFLQLLEDGVFDTIRHEAGLDVVQEVGRFTFREPPKVELRDD